MEPHYSPQQVAEQWGLSANTIRRIFKDEPGVIKYGAEENVYRRKRGYQIMRLPESVVRRVHERLRVKV